jgi:putative copper resistance protein D
VACHGKTGAGDGEVAKLFPKPPHLARQVPRDYTDARLFHVPMRGQGSMPSHARQFEDEELWSVVHYLRALQASQAVAPPDAKDLEGKGAQP